MTKQNFLQGSDVAVGCFNHAKSLLLTLTFFGTLLSVPEVAACEFKHSKTLEITLNKNFKKAVAPAFICTPKKSNLHFDESKSAKINTVVPLVTVNGTLTAFSYNEGEGPSGRQTLVISGSNLDSDITITALENYEIATTQTFDVPLETIVLTKNSSNIVTSKNIHIRLKSGLSMGNYNGILNVDTENLNVTKDLVGEVNTPVGKIFIEANSGTFPDITANTNTPTFPQNTQFAGQLCNSTSLPKSFRIQNRGGATFSVTSISIGGLHSADFSVLSPTVFPFDVAPQEVVLFEIQFSPTAAFERLATVNIANSSANNTLFIFNIKGTGQNAEIEISGNAVLIPSGSTSVSSDNHTYMGTFNTTDPVPIAKTFKVSNLGNLKLDVSEISLTGTDANSFTVVPSMLSIDSGKVGVFTIIFTAISPGIKNATVQLVNTDLTGNENPYTFAIQGLSTAFTPCATEILGAEQVVAHQDFESDGIGWAYSGTNYALAGSPLFAVLINSPAVETPSAIGLQSYQVNNTTSELEFEFDTSNFVDVNFSFRLGSFSTVSSVAGADALDFVLVEISNDGGMTYIPEVKIEGSAANKRWGFDAVNSSSTAINYQEDVVASDQGNEKGVSTITVTNLPSVSNLKVKLTLKNINDNANEIWAIDEVFLKGKPKPNLITNIWNGSEWSNIMPPTSSQKVIIDGAYNALLNGSIAACSCEITSTGSVTIASGHTLEVEDHLNNNGVLTILDSGSLVQRNDAAVNTGEITMQRFTQPMLRYDFTYWSSPIFENGDELKQAGEFSLFDLSPYTLFDKYFSWGTASWMPHNRTTTAMLSGKGYIVRAPQSFAIEGAMSVQEVNFVGKSCNGVIKKSVQGSGSNSSSSYKWNLLGNPYPSAIDAKKFLLANPNLEGTLYFWTHNTPVGVANVNYQPNDYASWNWSGGVGTAASETAVGPSAPLGSIAAGQAFFVKGIVEGTSEVTFTNAIRLVGQNAQFYKTSISEYNQDVLNTDKHRIWLNVRGEEKGFNQILVGYILDATNGFDTYFDGESFGGNFVTFYSILDTKNLVIQGRALPFSDEDIVSLGYKTTLTGNLIISIDHVDGLMVDQDIYLQDNVLNVVHNLKASAYTFAAVPGTFNSRFVLRYVPQVDLSHPTFDEQVKAIRIYKNQANLYVNSPYETIATVAVYDITGRKLFEQKDCNTNRFETSHISTVDQVLIVKVTLKNRAVVTEKVF